MNKTPTFTVVSKKFHIAIPMSSLSINKFIKSRRRLFILIVSCVYFLMCFFLFAGVFIYRSIGTYCDETHKIVNYTDLILCIYLNIIAIIHVRKGSVNDSTESIGLGLDAKGYKLSLSTLNVIKKLNFIFYHFLCKIIIRHSTLQIAVQNLIDDDVS